MTFSIFVNHCFVFHAPSNHSAIRSLAHHCSLSLKSSTLLSRGKRQSVKQMLHQHFTVKTLKENLCSADFTWSSSTTSLGHEPEVVNDPPVNQEKKMIKHVFSLGSNLCDVVLLFTVKQALHSLQLTIFLKTCCYIFNNMSPLYH